jgi:putative PIG3 family NAD(P)H quinone oxidoreductase
MRAISIDKPGGPEVLQIRQVEQPAPGKGEVLVRVRAVGVNRADVLQRAGHYPAPPGVPANIPGLEFAGEVAAVADDVADWKIGDRIFGLAAGGTYAEFVVVHARTPSRIPDNLSFVEAAAVPEAFVTAYDAMISQCGLSAGEKVLITAVGSGVGLAALQLARATGAITIGTSRSADKLQRSSALGLHHAILVGSDGYDGYHETVLQFTENQGADVILELVGGAYLSEDLKCAALKGRIIVVGLMAGRKVETDLGVLLRKRLTLKGTTLRARPLEEKILAGQLLSQHIVPLLASGQLLPCVDKQFPIEQAAEAHAYMEDDGNFGKIVLTL